MTLVSEYGVIIHLHNELNESPKAENHNRFLILQHRNFQANMIRNDYDRSTYLQQKPFQINPFHFDV